MKYRILRPKKWVNDNNQRAWQPRVATLDDEGNETVAEPRITNAKWDWHDWYSEGNGTQYEPKRFDTKRQAKQAAQEFIAEATQDTWREA